MDGTLVNSEAGVKGAWETFAKTYPYINVQETLIGVCTHFVSRLEFLIGLDTPSFSRSKDC